MINNLEWYRIFYYVAKEKQFSAAARELCVSQPAVSQAIKLLEEQLHCSLFLRTSKGVRLTAEGETLFTYIEKAYEHVNEGERLVANMCSLERGEVCIGASDMTLQFYLLPYLERFHIQYPGINIRVTNAPSPATLEALQQGRIDFGVISTPIENCDRLSVRSVKRIRDVIVAGTRFLELKHRTVPLEQIAKYPIVCLEKKTSSRRFWNQCFEEKHLKLQPEFELATSDMIVQFARKNMGLGIVMRDFAERYLEDGSLFEVLLDQKPLYRDICVVTNQERVVSVASQKLLEMLEMEKGYS